MKKLLHSLREQSRQFMIRRVRKPIEGSQSDHLYPRRSMAVPRQLSDWEQAMRKMDQFQADVAMLARRGSSTAEYLTESESTSLIIASRHKA